MPSSISDAVEGTRLPMCIQSPSTARDAGTYDNICRDGIALCIDL